MFEEIVRKISALGVPGLMLMMAVNATGLAGAAALTAALAALGPGGMIGGIVTLGFAGIIAESIAEFGFDRIYSAVVANLYAKGETKDSIRCKISRYPVSKKLKVKLLDELAHYQVAKERPIESKTDCSCAVQNPIYISHAKSAIVEREFRN